MPSKTRCQNAPAILILFLFSILEKNKLDELNKRFHVKGTEGKSLVPRLIEKKKVSLHHWYQPNSCFGLVNVQ